VGSAALLPAATEEPPLSMQKPGWQYHEYHADIESDGIRWQMQLQN